MKVGKRFHQTKVSRNWFFAPFLTHVLWQSMVHSRKMIPIDIGVWHCINNYDVKYIIEIYVLVLSYEQDDNYREFIKNFVSNKLRLT